MYYYGLRIRLYIIWCFKKVNYKTIINININFDFDFSPFCLVMSLILWTSDIWQSEGISYDNIKVKLLRRISLLYISRSRLRWNQPQTIIPQRNRDIDPSRHSFEIVFLVPCFVPQNYLTVTLRRQVAILLCFLLNRSMIHHWRAPIK